MTNTIKNQNEWLKKRIAWLQLGKKDYDRMDEWLTECGMPAVEERLPQDVINLVIAVRNIEYPHGSDYGREWRELDKAVEVFSERVPYENEPE